MQMYFWLPYSSFFFQFRHGEKEGFVTYFLSGALHEGEGKETNKQANKGWKKKRKESITKHLGIGEKASST